MTTESNASDSHTPRKPVRLIFPRGVTGEEAYRMIQEAMARHRAKTPDEATAPAPDAKPDGA
jgi:hypothetical protein